MYFNYFTALQNLIISTTIFLVTKFFKWRIGKDICINLILRTFHITGYDTFNTVILMIQCKE